MYQRSVTHTGGQTAAHNGEQKMKIKDIIKQHQLWIENKPGGSKAIFYKKDMSGMDLRGVDLQFASMYKVNLSNADLRGANLSNIEAFETRITGALLDDANLHNSDLKDSRWIII